MLGDIDYAALGFETFHDEVLAPLIVIESHPLDVTVHQCMDHIGSEEAAGRAYEEVEPGFRWGPIWSTAWFRLRGHVPESMRGRPIVLHFSSGTEALLWRNGTPAHGFDPYHHHAPLGTAGEGTIELLIEAACNRPLGASLFWWEHGEEHGRWKESRPGRLDAAELQVRDDLAERFARTWLFATRLMRTADAAEPTAHQLDAGLRKIRSALLAEDRISITKEHLLELEALLQDGNKRPTTCVAMGHAHIDTAWLWPIRETRRKCLRTFATQLQNLERHPDFRFLCSQPQQYAWVEADSPDLFERISRQVENGRWEAAGAMWIEPDANIPSGESLIRQIVHGTRYWKDRFGDAAPQEFLYLPDTFGFPASLPQICRLAGLETFITNKIAWSETNRFPHVTFNWRGIDGSEVMSHFTPGHNYNSSIMPQDFVDAEERLLSSDGTRAMTWLQPYGWGDGGGGPDEEQIMNAELAAISRGMPDVASCSTTEFCRRLHASFEDGPPPPVWDGELYLELHRGTYTTHARLKASNRRAERDLREIEILTTAGDVADREVIDGIRPWLDRTWKQVLLNQFHDIIPGSSIGSVYEDAHRDLDAVHLDCTHELTEGLRRIETLVDTRHTRRPLLVWNPCSTGRTAVVESEAGLRIARDVPGLGIRIIDLADDAAPKESVQTGPRSLANGLLEIELDDAGCIRRLASNEHSVGFDDPMNTLVIHPDRPRRWEAWDLDRDYTDVRIPQVESGAEISVQDDGPLRGSIRVSRKIGRSSSITQRYILDAGSRVLRIENDLDWQEDHAILRAEFAPSIRARSATYGIQFGSIERPTHANTSWEKAAFEVPGHLWMDLSQPGRGLAVLDDGSRFGRSCRDNVMGLSLVRATSFPDPEADRGRHEFSYGLMPHGGDWRSAGVDEEAEAFGCRMRSVPAPAGVHGRINDGWSALPVSCSDTSVEIAACKPSESGDGVVVRIVERRGGTGSVRIELPTGRSTGTLVDLHENPIEDEAIEVRSGGLEVKIGPYQIRSILMR
ncbi:MAG: glycosyl hydrolase-related protein [Phycisphaerales bacterium]|nr:glycosyl hydrolase-related protein [Phycisphaerales bacterium]